MKPMRVVALAALIGALAVATVAGAAGTLTVAGRGPSTVTYPMPVQFKVSWTETATVPIEVQMRYTGGDWRTIRTISATRAALAPQFGTVVVTKPKAAFEVRAIQGSLESSVATGAVRAKMTGYAARGSYRSSDATVTLRGSIAPTHTVGAAVTAKVWKLAITRGPRGHGRPVLTRTLVGEFPGAVYRTSGGTSFWRADFATPAKGDYEVRVTHEDAEHALSTTRAFGFRVK